MLHRREFQRPEEKLSGKCVAEATAPYGAKRASGKRS